MRRFTRIEWILVALAASLACIGCGDDEADERSGLTIFYEFDGLDCAAAGVEEIVILGEGTSEEEGFGELLLCPLHPEAVLVGALSPGVYEIEVQGLSPEGVMLYRTREPISVRVDEDMTVTIDVPFTTGDLTVAWGFEGSQGCGAVQLVEVVLIDPFDIVADESTYECADRVASYEGLQTGEWIVEVEGFDAEGRTLSLAQPLNVFIAPDAEADASVRLGVID